MSASQWSRGAYAAALIGISILGLFLRLHGVTEQYPDQDEVLSAFTAENYMERGIGGPTMPYHPNLRNILLYASLKLLGPGALGLRSWSLLLGALSVPLLALMVYLITREARASLIAAALLALDPLHIAYSRQSIQEAHTAFFALAGVALAAYFATGVTEEMRRERVNAWGAAVLLALPVSGVCFGLGGSSKIQGAFPLMACLPWVLWASWRARWPLAGLLAVLSLTLLPLGVYLLTYLPWFGRGYGLGDWVFMQRALFAMTVEHTGNPMDTMLDISARLWFVKPLMAYGNFAESEAGVFVTLAVSNPVTWLLVLPSGLYLALKGGRGAWVLVLVFAAAYLPLALATRPIWLLSAVAVVPFALAMVGVALNTLAERAGLKYLYAYLGAVLVTSMLLYPLSVGKGLEKEYLRPLLMQYDPHGGKYMGGEP